MNGFTQVIGATGPCQHAWSFAPTLSYYQCVNCMERHDHGTPGYEAIAAAQVAMLTTQPASDAAVPAGPFPEGAKPLVYSSALAKFADNEATVPHGYEIWVHTTSPLLPTQEDAYAWAEQYVAAAAPKVASGLQYQGCNRPPDGWWCCSEPGHDGPCPTRQMGEL